jgi:hypothetical protein
MTEKQWTIILQELDRFEKSFEWIKDAKPTKRINAG